MYFEEFYVGLLSSLRMYEINYIIKYDFVSFFSTLNKEELVFELVEGHLPL